MSTELIRFTTHFRWPLVIPYCINLTQNAYVLFRQDRFMPRLPEIHFYEKYEHKTPNLFQGTKGGLPDQTVVKQQFLSFGAQ